MKTKLNILAAMLCISSMSVAQIFTPGGIITGASGSATNVAIGPVVLPPAYQLHLLTAAANDGALFDAQNFLFGNGNAMVGSAYSGVFGQGNGVGNSPTSFTFGLTNTIATSMSSFSAGFSNNISNSVGGGGCIALGGNNNLDMTEESAAIGEDNTINNGHGSIALGGHNVNDGAYTFTLGSGLSNSIGNSLMAGFNDTTFFIGNNRVGIGNITNPQALLHVGDTIRCDALSGGGNVCADAFGNLILSGPCGGGGITNTCGTINQIPKGVDALGNLTCSQITDDGTSVGIGTAGPFAYVWAGGLTGPVLPPGAGTVKLDVAGVTRALAYIATSDANMKTNIKDIEEANEIIGKLSGKTYDWNQEAIQKTGAADVKQYGFIAQEVAEVLPEAVSVDESGLHGINYTYFIPLLTEAVKGQQAEMDEKNAEIEELKSQLNEMRDELSQMRDAINAINTKNGGIEGSYLEQNEPNPFSQSTTIRFALSDQVRTAEVYIYDLNGTQKATYVVPTGQSEVTVYKESLQPGIYIYNLIVDGKVADTKRMMITD